MSDFPKSTLSTTPLVKMVPAEGDKGLRCSNHGTELWETGGKGYPTLEAGSHCIRFGHDDFGEVCVVKVGVSHEGCREGLPLQVCCIVTEVAEA